MRNPGSSRVVTALEVVIIKDLLVKDPLRSLYYFNNGSSQIYCFQRSLIPQRQKGSRECSQDISRECSQDISAARNFFQQGERGCWSHIFASPGKLDASLVGQIFSLTGWRDIMGRGSWEVDVSMGFPWLKHG